MLLLLLLLLLLLSRLPFSLSLKRQPPGPRDCDVWGAPHLKEKQQGQQLQQLLLQ